jgi:hypothetical protein
MTDIIERLRIESRREPHEPIWRDAIDEIEALRAEVDRLNRYYKNGIDCFANPCERHSGERTPPFAEFFEKYGGQCLICVVDNNKALQAERDALREALKEIRSRSSIDLAMRSDQFELTAMLGDIHQIADVALAQETKA